MGGGSDDIAEVSWNIPTVRLRYPANIPGMTGHHWSSGIAMATPIAHKGSNHGARVIAMTAIDLIADAALLAEAKRYFEEVTQLKEYRWESLIPLDTPPPTISTRSAWRGSARCSSRCATTRAATPRTSSSSAWRTRRCGGRRRNVERREPVGRDGTAETGVAIEQLGDAAAEVDGSRIEDVEDRVPVEEAGHEVRPLERTRQQKGGHAALVARVACRGVGVEQGGESRLVADAHRLDHGGVVRRL
jgi:hypothetical protein